MSDDRRALVAVLRQLPGVSEVALERGPSGEALRLRLLDGVDQAAVADAVSRVLRERFGADVDVGLADDGGLADDAGPVDEAERLPGASRLEPGETDSPEGMARDTVVERVGVLGESDARRRPAIARVQLRNRGLDATAVVTLEVARPPERGPTRVSGTATGAATPSGSQRAVASATLRAVEALVGGSLGRIRLEAEHVSVVRLGTGRIAAVAVELLQVAGGERFTGAAEVRDDVAEAVVRATLDAVNRRLEQLLLDVEAEHVRRG